MLTTEDLKSLVIRADRGALCDALAPLTEPERKTLASYAAKLSQWMGQFWGPGKSEATPTADQDPTHEIRDLLSACSAETYPDWRCPRWTASLMAIGPLDYEWLMRAHGYWSRSDLAEMPQRVLQILSARRPPWLAKWLEKEWKQESPVPCWYVERGLIRCGALPANDTAEYYARMAADFSSISYIRHDSWVTDKSMEPQFRSIKQMLEADPQLFEHDIWRLFDVDSLAFRFRIDEWGKALVQLSQEGKLDRQRLLLRSLEGMALPLPAMTLSGFGKFHEMLDPSLDERDRLVENYLRLLASNNSAVVGSALSALEKLQKAKRLQAAPYLAALPNAFLVDKKSQPISAIKLAVKLMKQLPEYQTVAAKAIVPAIHHANADVQTEAITVLQNCKELLDEECRSELSNAMEQVAVAVRPVLQKLLESFGTLSPTCDDGSSPQKESTKSTVRLSKQPLQESAVAVGSGARQVELQPDGLAATKEAAEFSESLQRDSRLAEAIFSLASNSMPSIQPLDKYVAPRRDPAFAVQPVSSLDELIELVSSVIEKIDDPMDLERVLDGIHRYFRAQPEDFDKRVGALRNRIASRIENHNQTVLYLGADIGFTQLLLSWLEMPPLNGSKTIHWYSMRGWFLRERIEELRNKIEYFRNPYNRYHEFQIPLLALPTHQGGWLDPVVLVERINNYYAKHRELTNCHDLAQAMLRLTPDGRSEALQMLGKPDHYNGNTPLRYALGGDCELKGTGGWGAEAVLVAACRARTIGLRGKEAGTKLPIARAILGDDQTVQVVGAYQDDPTVPFSLAEVAFSTDPIPKAVVDPALKERWVSTWEAMTNPMDTEASCLAGHLSHLFDREATWSYEACRLGLLASSAERNETRILATDALIESIERLLVIPERLGDAMSDAFAYLTLNRTMKVLHEVALTSPLHHWVILQSLERCIEKRTELPNDIHLMLSQMLESAIILSTEVSAIVREKLTPLGNKSKAGKLATQLSQLQSTASFRSKINELIVAKSVQRAKRWKLLAHS